MARSSTNHRNPPAPEHLIFDIETVPDTGRWKKPEVPPGTEVPFPPTWAHRVVAIGCLWFDSAYRMKRLGVIREELTGLRGDLDERELLGGFSAFVAKSRPVLVTYNGRSFDLPVIAQRSLGMGLSIPWYYQGRGVRYRYSDEGHMDLCDWLAEHGATRSGSLDALARLIGLPGKIGVDGTQVEALYRAGQLAAIQSYCLSDVVQTAILFLRFRLLQGVLDGGAYRTAITELLDGLAHEPRVADVLAQMDRVRVVNGVMSHEQAMREEAERDDFFFPGAGA